MCYKSFAFMMTAAISFSRSIRLRGCSYKEKWFLFLVG